MGAPVTPAVTTTISPTVTAAPAIAAPAASSSGSLFTSIFSGLSQVASGMMQQKAAQQAAGAQIAYQNQLADRQEAQNYEQQVAIRQEQSQEEESINRKKIEAQLKTRGIKSTALTAAASSGVSGASIDALLSEYDVQSSMYLEGLERQKELDDAAATQNIVNIGQNVYIPAPVETPDSSLGILGAIPAFLEIPARLAQSSAIKKSNLSKL